MELYYTPISLNLRFMCDISNKTIFLKKKIEVHNSFYDGTGLSTLACKCKDHYHLLYIDKNGASREDKSLIMTYLEERGAEAKFAFILTEKDDFPGIVGEYEGKEITFLMGRKDFENLKLKGAGYEFLYKFKNGDIYRCVIDKDMKKIEKMKPVTLVKI